MDVQGCITLHNEILYHLWIHTGHTSSSFSTKCPSWMDFFVNTKPSNDDLAAYYEEAAPHLCPEILEFLNGARVIGATDGDDPDMDLSFHYWVGELEVPNQFFYMEEQFDKCLPDGRTVSSEKRYITLYSMNEGPHMPMGLVYDQKTHLSVLIPTIWDIDDIVHGKTPWHPLEIVLQAWLNMIKIGRMKVVPEDELQLYKNANSYIWDSCARPWVLLSYSTEMLQQTVSEFDQLIEAIEARMPAESLEERGAITEGLVDESVLQLLYESIGLSPGGFAFEFLTQARHPRFSMIAPGLQIPTSDNVFTQPFWQDSDLDPKSAGHIPNILLFRSQSLIPARTKGYSPSNRPTGLYAGLYLQSPNRSITADEIVLLLPFSIGANGYARKSDGTWSGDGCRPGRKSARNSFSDLFQPGFQPFDEPKHKCRLVSVLRSWRKMVERGDWEIGEDGVVGGMDVWREADTEEGWAKYVIPQMEIH